MESASPPSSARHRTRQGHPARLGARYGFPQPLRDAFSRPQPSRSSTCRLIKRLMDQGQRPAASPRQPLAALTERLAASPAKKSGADSSGLDHAQAQGARHRFLACRAGAASGARRPSSASSSETVPALNRRIGDGWMSGNRDFRGTPVHRNWCRTCCARRLPHALGGRGTRPQVLLTTVKDENLLGLLMVEALLAANGAYAVSLGAQACAVLVGAAQEPMPTSSPFRFPAPIPGARRAMP